MQRIDSSLKAAKTDGYAEGRVRQDEILAHNGQTFVLRLCRCIDINSRVVARLRR